MRGRRTRCLQSARPPVQRDHRTPVDAPQPLSRRAHHEVIESVAVQVSASHVVPEVVAWLREARNSGGPLDPGLRGEQTLIQTALGPIDRDGLAGIDDRADVLPLDPDHQVGAAVAVEIAAGQVVSEEVLGLRGVGQPVGTLHEQRGRRLLGLEPPRVELIRRAAPLHDVGKIGIPDSILLKPGKLTEEEFAVMKSHTTIGARILSGGSSELVMLAESIARSHHER
jgi:hypothetical protein